MRIASDYETINSIARFDRFVKSGGVFSKALLYKLILTHFYLHAVPVQRDEGGFLIRKEETPCISWNALYALLYELPSFLDVIVRRAVEILNAM